MSLMLKLINEITLPDGGPVSCHITGKRGIDIGRDAHLDWTLPDPTRYISSKHCEIRFKDGGYWLHDVSTNGTFLNGADHRMHAPHRLRTGDRFTVGHYIVGVTVGGEEGPADGVPPAARAVDTSGLQDLWLDEGDTPPPIDRKQLKPARQSAPVNPDFLDWAVDVPDPLHSGAATRSASTARQAPEPPTGSDMDWAAGPSSYIPSSAPAAPPAPMPRRPGLSSQGEGVWGEKAPARAELRSGAAVLPSGAAAPASTEPLATFLSQLAKGADLPVEIFAQKDVEELAQQIGIALRLVAENLIQLLKARQRAKQLARSSSHTMVEATGNNPLKFSASAAHALSIMFGPATQSYLDASRAISEGFEDLKTHQIKTYAAMQHALAWLMADLEPMAIERNAELGQGIASLLLSRKAKLWDTYQARWEAKFGRERGGLSEAFMRSFAEYYDRDGQ